jgi:ABC-type Fe3+-hydroxamate transport system substrate-binding protein
MKNAFLLALMILSAALFSGCTGNTDGENDIKTPTTAQYDDPVAAEIVLDDAVTPLIGENDTVEIGEMI